MGIQISGESGECDGLGGSCSDRGAALFCPYDERHLSEGGNLPRGCEYRRGGSGLGDDRFPEDDGRLQGRVLLVYFAAGQRVLRDDGGRGPVEEAAGREAGRGGLECRP